MRAFFAPLLLGLWLFFLPIFAHGQVNSGEEIPTVTRTHALVNARVVQAPTRMLERATVVIRDGLITAVGSDVTIPFDAEKIAADSLTVYAGFIDGLSHAGIPEPPKAANEERPENPGFPPDAMAGIQPGRDVRTLLDPTQQNLKDLRAAGFTAAHVVPRGGMLPGSGAIILLAGEHANDLVVKGNTALFAQITPARRMYPATDMGVIATMRQLYREAARRKRIDELYNKDPAGLERPAYDPVHYALFPVLGGATPVYFHTEDALDLHRILLLRSELEFPVVLTGLGQSFEVVDKLRQAGHPLLLGTKFPKAPKQKGQEPADSTKAQPTDAAAELPEVAIPAYRKDLRTMSYTDVDAERKNLEARRDLERKKYLTNAATLHEAGLSFGFTTLDTKPADIIGNVRTMIEHGLPEHAALAALTTTPAEILGVSSSMGTVDVGKMANLVVTKGSIFENDVTIRYVFIDGAKFVLEPDQEKQDSTETEESGDSRASRVAMPQEDAERARDLTEVRASRTNR